MMEWPAKPPRNWTGDQDFREKSGSVEGRCSLWGGGCLCSFWMKSQQRMSAWCGAVGRGCSRGTAGEAAEGLSEHCSFVKWPRKTGGMSKSHWRGEPGEGLHL